jgi:hypothetical protein
MSSGTPTNSARRTFTYAAGDLVDADGIKTSFATVAAPVTVVPADFNGAMVSAVTGIIAGLPRSLTIARSSAANQYSVVPIVITGKRGGLTVTESLTPANDDGNDILRTTAGFDTVTSIAIPTQAGTGGAFTIGVQDICAPWGDTFVGVELAAAGNINCQYGEGVGSPADSIPVSAAQVGVIKPIAPSRIRTNASLTNPTTVGLTVYLP